jgi:hypothetical protein
MKCLMNSPNPMTIRLFRKATQPDAGTVRLE